MNRVPRGLVIVSFIGGCSFLGFHFLPAWLFAPLFFLTPVVGPLLLLIAGLLSMRRARLSDAVSSAPSHMVAATLAGCVAMLVPIAAADFLLFGALPYIGLLLLFVAVPYQVVCAGTFVAGLYALVRVNDRAVVPLIVGAAAGIATGITLAVVRIEVVPRSHGVFLHAFSGSGAAVPIPGRPLDRYGQRDIAETLGVQPRSHHEPIVEIDDDGLWLARRSADTACAGYWIERKALEAGGREWRRCLPTAPAPTRNPTATAHDSSGGMIVVGFDVLTDGTESAWIKRFDAGGVEDARWDKSFGTGRTVDRAYGVRIARDGFIYVVGESGDTHLPGTTGWVRKFGSDGSEIRDGWDKRFPNAGERRPTMAAVAAATDSTGDVYVLLDLYNAYSVRKFDPDGRQLWDKALMPGPKDLAMTAADNGDVFISGASGYPDQAWIRKVNADGSDAWEKTFAQGHLSSALALAFDRSGNIYVAGYGTDPTDRASYWWIRKIGSDAASEQWRVVLSGPDNDNAPFQLHVTEGGEVYALGKGSGWQFSGSLLERYWGW